MFHYAQLLRLGLADTLLPDGSTAVNSQAAQQHIEQAMQQELLLNLPLQEPARTCLTVVNVGMPKSWVLAGDLHCAGLWGTAAASNSLQEAMQAYQKAVQLANLPPAFAGIGRLEERQGNEEAALSWYSKAAAKQYSAAELALAKLLAAAIKNDDSGTMVRAEKRAALLAAMKAAKHGLPRAKALAGTLKEDARKAAVLLQEAVEEDGHAECLLALALAYAHGVHGLPRDHAKGMQLLQQAALEEGWPEALDDLGNAYAGGFWGVTSDPGKALRMFEHAAHLGVQPAMYKAAGAHLAGAGTPASLSKAKLWAQRALDAAADAEAKRDAQITLQDVQGKMLQYGEDQWRATVQHSWESLQDGGAGRCVAEAVSNDPDFTERDRQRYMSFVMSVAQSACKQPPSDAAAGSADTSSSTGAAAPSNHQQQQQYPSSAELTKVLGGANSAEGNLRSRAAITAFFADLGSFQLAGELQRQAKSSELQRCCWDVIAGLDDWEGGIQALAAAYALYPKGMRLPGPDGLSILQAAARVYSKRHPGCGYGQIVHTFIEGNSRSLLWIAQELAGVILKVPQPVLRGFLLLTRSGWLCAPDTQDKWQGALDDAEAGLLLLPEHPELLFIRAWALKAVKYDTLAEHPAVLSSNSSSAQQQQLARRQQAAAEAVASYQRYLDAAPEVHRSKPAALYYLAFIPLNEGIAVGEPGMPIADVVNRSQTLYNTAKAAEAQLPQEWLPVKCAVHNLVPAYLELRRCMGGVALSSTTGGSSSNSSSNISSSSGSSAAAVTSRAQEGHSSGPSKDSSTTSSSSSMQAHAQDGAGSSDSKGKSSRSGSSSSSSSSTSKGCCAACGASGVKLRNCSGCKQVVYCNRECQAAHWKQHKKVCSRMQ
uniref:MYND-type domain-containing protein n=1 Tax=Tetradesmus obliquus TaxID=3088 RepID=A0A383WBQ3_TETOB|eukprot:jgi/Sobl393_1/11133/SZX74640.1